MDAKLHNILFGKTVADLGFPRGGGANSRGAPAYDFAKISQKLHEIERIWTRGGGVSKILLCRFATVKYSKVLAWHSSVQFCFHFNEIFRKIGKNNRLTCQFGDGALPLPLWQILATPLQALLIS